VSFSVRNRGIQFFWTGAGANGEERGYARSAGALQHGFAIIRKLWEIDVRVRVD
jgi:hypothetical protein